MTRLEFFLFEYLPNICKYLSDISISQYLWFFCELKISSLMGSLGWWGAHIHNQTFQIYLDICQIFWQFWDIFEQIWTLWFIVQATWILCIFVGDNIIHCTSQCIEVLTTSEKRNQASEFNRCHTIWSFFSLPHQN